MTQRNRDFIDYMESSGAHIGGPSGAGGGSPKFLLREDEKGRLHAEGWLDDHKTAKAYLVKLPYTDSENSQHIIVKTKSRREVVTYLRCDGDAIFYG